MLREDLKIIWLFMKNRKFKTLPKLIYLMVRWEWCIFRLRLRW